MSKPSTDETRQIVRRVVQATAEAEERLSMLPGRELPAPQRFDGDWPETTVAVARAGQLLTWATDELEQCAWSAAVKTRKGNRNA